MDDIKEKINAEKEYIEKILTILKETIELENKSVVELTAVGAFLQNAYNGIEKILKIILKHQNIEIPQSSMWHKDLLNSSVTNGIISALLCDELYRYLSFRHFFIHSYGFMIEEEEIRSLAADISDVWKKFVLEIDGFQ